MTSIAIQSDAHWHELRSKTVGGSEVGSLFGLSPFMTEWELFMIKSGKLPPKDLDGVKHVTAGKFFEAGVMGWARQKWDMQVRKVHRYLVSDQCAGMGATLDYEEEGIGRRRPVEIKFPFSSDGWDWDGDTITLAPDLYVLQCQQEIECSGSQDGVLVAYLGGDVRRAVYQRRDSMIQAMRERVTQFWADIAAGKEPPIDFKADADAVMKYAAAMPARKIEWNLQMRTWAEAASTHAELAKQHADDAKAIKAQIANALMEGAKKLGANDEDGKVVCEGDGFRITRSLVAPNEGTLITPEMVGTRTGARKGYPLITISQPKAKGKS